MRIFHLRDVNKRPFATIAIEDGAIGASFCHPNDQFNKERGRQIAIGRLNKGAFPNIPNRNVEWSVTGDSTSLMRIFHLFNMRAQSRVDQKGQKVLDKTPV